MGGANDADEANGALNGGGSLFRVGESVSVANLLVFLSLLVVFIVALEQLLHKLEHSVKQSHKHEEMLRKVYRELMILGFLGVAIKVYKEITHVSAYSTAIVAFQCADLTIFILAIALILQASCVFLALRHENYELEEAELLSASDLATTLATQSHQHQHSVRRVGWSMPWCCVPSRKCDSKSDADTRDLVELRVLRHLFLRRYGLPELFPFSKYVRQAQDNQITHMIDVEISMWLLLLGVAWAIDGAIVLFQHVDAFRAESHAIVLVFLVFSWSLVVLHGLVAVYFRRCLVQLLRAGGLSHWRDAASCLTTIGHDENVALQQAMASDALAAMQEVQERQEVKYREAKLRRRRRRGTRHHLVERDTGFQLLVTAGRHVVAWFHRRSTSTDNDDEASKPSEQERTHGDSDTLSVTPSATPTESIDLGVFDSGANRHQQHHHDASDGAPLSRRRSTELRVQIAWFSRKAWQFGVMLLMMLNAFYLALLCQCVFYQFGLLATYSRPLQVAVVVGLPLPVVLNMVLFQPQILRNFMIVSSILQVDVATLSKVVTHFSEIVELRAEFVRTLLACLHNAGVSQAEFQLALEARDRERSGLLDVEQLRLVLRAVGFRLSHFRFNSVAKLLFQLRGATVEVAQVLRMITLAQPALDEELQIGVGHDHPHPGHVLLRQSVFFEDADAQRLIALVRQDDTDGHEYAVTSEPARAGGSSGHPDRTMLTSVPETTETDRIIAPADGMGRPCTFARRTSNFQNTSARALRSLYLLSDTTDHGTSTDASGSLTISHGVEETPASPTSASVYTRMCDS